MGPGRRRSTRTLVGLALVGTIVIAGGGGARVPSSGADPDPNNLVADAGGIEAGARLTRIVHHAFPVTGVAAPYDHTHHDYPATDIAVPCGSRVVSAVDGVVQEINRVDLWNPVTDVPSTRGGKTVVVDGDDGVRYLFAHFSAILGSLQVGQRVAAGDPLGASGNTGHSTGCHLHIGLSPPCPTRVWDRLAGTVWPWPYLDAWRAHDNIGPAAEVAAWTASHPHGCDAGAILVPAGPATGSAPGLPAGFPTDETGVPPLD